TQGAGEEPLAAADVDDPAGPVEHDAFDVGVAQPGDDVVGGDDGAVGQFTHGGEGAVAGHHGDQRPGRDSIGGHGRGTGGHLHQRVGAALGGGASELQAGGAVAEPLPGFGPVGHEQAVLEAGGPRG